MASTHALASGMGGMRTAGDLVARMQMTRGGCSVADLSDTVAMHDIRRDLGLGRIIVQDLTYADHPGAMEAKFHIADVLDIPINCVKRFKEHAGLA